MAETIQELFTEVKQLLDSAKEDYAQKRWGNHEYYVTEVNLLLSRAQSLGVECGTTEIREADRDQVIHTSGTLVPGRTLPMEPSIASKIRKLREIINVTERLLRKVAQVAGLNLNNESSPLILIENLCSRFHTISRQLRSRRENRSTIEIEDEYDVQDLLHALLRIHFEDVRTEEWTPSYAGGSARMDFLLKSEQIVIEAKKTRKGLAARELGEQLIIDIEKYSKHPDCKSLICFVYDPEGRIANPRGVEIDLHSRSDERITVIVYIKPYAV
jgi:hypothetical protein